MKAEGDGRKEARDEKPEFVSRPIRILWALVVLSLLLSTGTQATDAYGTDKWTELSAMERQVKAYVPEKNCPDDPYVLVTLQEAITAIGEGNGGIGACLVREATGEIVERGHNRQYEPYFRSDLHAEMDLLTRYEERVRGRRQGAGIPTGVQRKMEGLVLYTSLEPCPMCLTRIINAGVKKVYFAAPDPTGGMAHKMRNLPPFWQDRASGQIFEPARCSTHLKELAWQLFRHSMARRSTR
ncbi:MAG TPA: nucleoside deaminase [Deltaproteobacteria bacterium]|nr:nucleoside deaminase [Deltaproteobacteria bacterium]